MAMKFKTLRCFARLIAALAVPTTAILNGLLGLTQIKGTVYCTANGNDNVNNAITTPVFGNKFSVACSKYHIYVIYHDISKEKTLTYTS